GFSIMRPDTEGRFEVLLCLRVSALGKTNDPQIVVTHPTIWILSECRFIEGFGIKVLGAIEPAQYPENAGYGYCPHLEPSVLVEHCGKCDDSHTGEVLEMIRHERKDKRIYIHESQSWKQRSCKEQQSRKRSPRFAADQPCRCQQSDGSQWKQILP